MKRKPLKTYKFKLAKFDVDFAESLYGYCKIPNEKPNMTIPDGSSRKNLCVVIHEAMHAEGVPDRFLDGEWDSAESIGKFLWQLGWRKA